MVYLGPRKLGSSAHHAVSRSALPRAPHITSKANVHQNWAAVADAEVGNKPVVLVISAMCPVSDDH